MPGSARMAIPGVLLTQSFKSTTCSRHTLHMKGVLAFLEDNGFFWVRLKFWSMLGFSGWRIGFMVAADV